MKERALCALTIGTQQVAAHRSVRTYAGLNANIRQVAIGHRGQCFDTKQANVSSYIYC